MLKASRIPVGAEPLPTFTQEQMACHIHQDLYQLFPLLRTWHQHLTAASRSQRLGWASIQSSCVYGPLTARLTS